MLARRQGLVVYFLLFILFPCSVFSGVCPESPTGYFSPVPGSPSTYSYTADTMPSGFVARPPTLSCAELQELHTYCIDRINMYRSGTLKFSDGTSDANLGTPQPLVHAAINSKCESELTLGDYKLMVSGGGCGAGAHKNAWACRPPMSGSLAQNSCCPRSGSTLAQLKSTLNGCLQQMWDEGLPGSSQTGHWINMKNAGYVYGSCGFAFTSGGGVLMNQNFASSLTSTKSPTKLPTSNAPTKSPTQQPTTASPTIPTEAPTRLPTQLPTTASPTPDTLAPTTTSPTTTSPTTTSPTSKSPSKSPTVSTPSPTTKSPTSKSPTSKTPTRSPTVSKSPTSKAPTRSPTVSKSPTSKAPTTRSPSSSPTKFPTKTPTTASPFTKSPVARRKRRRRGL